MSTVILMTVICMANYYQFYKINAVRDVELLQKKWIASIPDNLSYKVTEGCGWLRFSYQVFRSDKLNLYENVKNYETKYQKSISELFNVIKDATANADSLDVIYDTKHGFPKSIRIDWKKYTDDDECSYSVEKFKVVGTKL